jgi:RNA polymerase sigma-70 factor (ECF subfamily)
MVDVANQQKFEEKRRRFEALAMPAVNALYRQAMKLTNDPDDAQDLVQDTFERGFKAFDRFEPGSNFEAWMTTIQRNAFFNQYHKAKRRPQRANDSTGEYDDWDIYSASGHSSEGLKSAEQEYLEAFAPEEIMAALDTLSPERRQVFIDAAIDGKSYQQVADEQGIKIGTVMSRLNRARAQLKEELASYAKDRGYGEQRTVGRAADSGTLQVSPSAKSVDAAVHNGEQHSNEVAKAKIARGLSISENRSQQAGDASTRGVEGPAEDFEAIDGRKG